MSDCKTLTAPLDHCSRGLVDDPFSKRRMYCLSVVFLSKVSRALISFQVKIYFALMHLHPLDVRITYRGTPGSEVQDADELTLSTMAQLDDARYMYLSQHGCVVRTACGVHVLNTCGSSLVGRSYQQRRRAFNVDCSPILGLWTSAPFRQHPVPASLLHVSTCECSLYSVCVIPCMYVLLLVSSVIFVSGCVSVCCMLRLPCLACHGHDA